MACLKRPLRLLLLSAITLLAVLGYLIYHELNGREPSVWVLYDLSWEHQSGLKDRSQATISSIQGSLYNSNYNTNRVHNRTLGFEKVFAIGLPERSDKRDALTLMAALTGVDLNWIDGVKPSAIPQKGVPYGIDTATLKDNSLGSWRGHMNVLRSVVASGVTSALILEDDMDWDVHVKDQLQSIAQGVRYVTQEKSRNPDSPYGENWDLLWLGHCGEPFPEELDENAGLNASEKERISPKYEIKDDETVPPYSRVSNLVEWSNFAPGTRIVHRSAAPICSFAYAVSQTGACKLLHALSIDGLHMAFDNSLAQLCRDAAFDLARGREEGYGLRCVSVNPTMFFHHKAKGRLSGDSDIQSYGVDGSTRERGITESIMWSMRLNLHNILSGEALEAQYMD